MTTKPGLAVLAVALATFATDASAQTMAPTVPTAPTPTATTPIERYIAAAIDANPVLAAAERNADIAESARREAARGYLPSLGLNARFTRSGGGRTIEFPVGDLLNPVYQSLNVLTGSSAFPTIENESFKLLRSREQETRLQFVQPLFQPQIRPASRAQRALASAASAEINRVRADVVAQVATGYVGWLQAAEAVDIYTAALASLNEAVRASERLVEAGLATTDAVFRIEADRAEVEQQLAEAEVTLSLAGAAFNTTLARDIDAPIEPMEVGGLTPVIRTPENNLPLPELAVRATTARPAIRQLDASIDAAVSLVQVERGAYLPSVVLAADYGIQGEGYAFDDEARFRTASVVMQWTLFDGRRRKERVAQAALRAEALREQRANTVDLITLQVRQAVAQARLAERNISVAERRLESARNAFRLTERRYGEGLATQLDLLDARSTLTSAQQSLSITRFDALKRWVEVNRATAL